MRRCQPGWNVEVSDTCVVIVVVTLIIVVHVSPYLGPHTGGGLTDVGPDAGGRGNQGFKRTLRCLSLSPWGQTYDSRVHALLGVKL